MKVRRQCPHVLLVKECWREGKPLGSEGSKGNNLSRIFIAFHQNFDVRFGRTALG
jgi:hypothetical protein